MKPVFTLRSGRLLALCAGHGPTALRAAEAPTQRPNILFVIADDASSHFGQAYGCGWVKTPNIDRLACGGLVFDNHDSPKANTKRQNTQARPKQISDYLVYLPEGDEVKVDLSAAAGEQLVEWIHPVEGQVIASPAVSGGASVTLKPPQGGATVLHLKKM